MNFRIKMFIFLSVPVLHGRKGKMPRQQCLEVLAISFVDEYVAEIPTTIIHMVKRVWHKYLNYIFSRHKDILYTVFTYWGFNLYTQKCVDAAKLFS